MERWCGALAECGFIREPSTGIKQRLVLELLGTPNLESLPNRAECHLYE
jgi:hypothetical protein